MIFFWPKLIYKEKNPKEAINDVYGGKLYFIELFTISVFKIIHTHIIEDEISVLSLWLKSFSLALKWMQTRLVQLCYIHDWN